MKDIFWSVILWGENGSLLSLALCVCVCVCVFDALLQPTHTPNSQSFFTFPHRLTDFILGQTEIASSGIDIFKRFL
jgi:hypothetical protein